MSGGVALVLEDFGKGGLALEEVHPVNRLADDGVDPSADVVAAGEEGGARGRADWGPGVEIGEAHAFGSQFVEDGSLDGTAVASDVAVAQVVGKEGDDVRAGCGAQGGGRDEDKG